MKTDSENVFIFSQGRLDDIKDSMANNKGITMVEVDSSGGTVTDRTEKLKPIMGLPTVNGQDKMKTIYTNEAGNIEINKDFALVTSDDELVNLVLHFKRHLEVDRDYEAQREKMGAYSDATVDDLEAISIKRGKEYQAALEQVLDHALKNEQKNDPLLDVAYDDTTPPEEIYEDLINSNKKG